MEVDEPRPNCRRGQIPLSKNVPFTELLTENMYMFKTEEEIRSVFIENGIDLNKNLINSCGSGLTAAVLFFA